MVVEAKFKDLVPQIKAMTNTIKEIQTKEFPSSSNKTNSVVPKVLLKGRVEMFTQILVHKFSSTISSSSPLSSKEISSLSNLHLSKILLGVADTTKSMVQTNP